jgi:hypothetical protein
LILLCVLTFSTRAFLTGRDVQSIPCPTWRHDQAARYGGVEKTVGDLSGVVLL